MTDFPRRWRLEGDMISGQSAGCALSVQVRYTRFLWFPVWAQGRTHALVDIKAFVPRANPEKGYQCIGFSLRVGDTWIIKRRRAGK